MTDSRYFKNNFEDYVPPHDLIDKHTSHLSSIIRANLLRTISKFLEYFEKQVKPKSDMRDFSVYTGSSGYSLLYLLASEVFPEKKNEYFEKAVQHTNDALHALSKSRHNVPHTFLCGDVGPIAIMAVLLYKNEQIEKSNEYLTRLINIDVSKESADEMLYGRAGYLYALLFAQKHIPSQTIITKDHLRNVIKEIINSGTRTADKYGMKNVPLFYIWYDEAYVGAAHGFAGIFYLLLECKDLLSSDELNDIIKPSIDNLSSYKFKSGNYKPTVESRTDNLVHWCHGAPGLVYLFSSAYKIFGDERYIEEALECGEVVWKRGLLRKGYGICHGVAGNAYTFLHLYQLTKDEKHLYRAVKFAEWCSSYGSHGCRTPDTPNSLFEGFAGTIYFLIDILSPSKSLFPAYQLH